MAKHYSEAKNYLKEALENQEAFVEPQNAELSDDEFMLLKEFSLRLNPDQKTQLIALICQKGPNESEDISDFSLIETPVTEDLTECGDGEGAFSSYAAPLQKADKPRPPKLACRKPCMRNFASKSSAGIPMHVYEMTMAPPRKYLIIGWFKDSNGSRRFLISIRQALKFEVPAIFGAPGTVMTDVTWEKMMMDLDFINADIKRLYGGKRDWKF